ncbi:hypothetical protein [Brevibacillus porteri]|uniref:hypothetical protein n=1 Tax=Brevibacillus porteri TaxID=2126350 RepID=UPI002E224AA6|nr:hypothetical protein [Brevibacillus porteri]
MWWLLGLFIWIIKVVARRVKKNEITKSLLAVAFTTAFLFTGYSQVAVPNVHTAEQSNDRSFDILLEIAKSDLEEKIFVKNGQAPLS